MAVDYAHTGYAQEQRTQKAVRLEAYLHGEDFTADEAAQLRGLERRAVERLAGVRVCSDETWALVIKLMRSAEAGVNR